ncbi:TetR/AcrR family transcriptional regulator [Micromonospora sp. NBC_01796]|uniref:TetR/AcrR family transcriptional regulator n=1 Tax=Micromonospora sp. NBC_01796 TaxID=2975987 RepID=UPI002DD9AE94|nr:TetR/AcrR family transcriptional regulator [Micromonospora sp. NBC_01796]WSA88382.1 TetR/AcrR family transcriptional regulator [Micromonospora sp. NBC_01796]
MTVDGRVVRGERTRTMVLDTAVALATEAGLDGLSLGQLADRLGVSKSGLFAHWRSKEELQLATVERARDLVIEQVIMPALRAPRGVRRLWALHDARLTYYGDGTLPGACFFANAEFEYNVHPGPVRDRLAACLDEWLVLVRRLATEAVTAGELAAHTDVGQLAYEIEALGLAAALQSRLMPSEPSYQYSRQAVLDRLRALCPEPDLLPEGST